ncbi:MAG: PhnD/SsuA/transferrin family substrate-binding protein [Polyangiaceae bacterium]
MEWFLRRWLGAGWLVEARVAESYGELAQLLGSGGADIGWTPPLVGARVEALGGRVLVRVVRGGATTFRAAIVGARRRPVEPRALRGLRAAWVDRESTAGYLLPRAWVRSAGADPDRVFASEAFAGTHQAALQMVLDDRADLTGVFAAAASAPAYTALDDLPASDRARLNIVGYTMEARTT